MGRRRWWLRDEPTLAGSLVGEVRSLARPLGSSADLDPLLEQIGEARLVLLGEASHGTAEYYDWRTRISQRLIEEKGFSFIAVEGDWPDCYRVNRYAKGFEESSSSARDVLHAFNRWPTWMWANEEIVDLVEWLRQCNEKLPPERRVGFYGLDVYSLWDSLYAVLAYLQKRDPASLAAARRAFQCFEPYGEDVQEYAAATRWVDDSCEDEVVTLLAEIRRSGPAYTEEETEARFNAEQNALVVKGAERYYRTMVRGGAESWNARDRHMTQTLERLLVRHGPQSKGIVWEHNTHIGDARYTDMADEGMVNVGQLVREQHGADDVILVGFASHRGEVIAGREWEAPMQRMPVPPARSGSWEDVLHRAGQSDKLLLFGPQEHRGPFAEQRGQRAIGVVYHPEAEYGNYVPTILSRRYDALLYIDRTGALHPLHDVLIEEAEVPETFPTGV